MADLTSYLRSLSAPVNLAGGYLDILLSMMGQQPKSGGKTVAQRPTGDTELSLDGGGGFGDSPGPGASKGTAESGKLEGNLATATNVASGIRQGVGLLGQLGLLGPTAATIASTFLGPLAPISITGLISRTLGGKPEYDPAYGLPNVQDIQDLFGVFAAEDQAKMNEAAIAAFNDLVAADQTGYGNYSSGKTTPGGWGASPSAPSPSVDPSLGYGIFGPDSSNSPGTAGMGPDSASGGPAGSEGSDRAKGGVDVIRKPTRLRFGEKKSAQPEVVVSVPRSMLRPGQQPNEASVESVMRGLLQTLRR